MSCPDCDAVLMTRGLPAGHQIRCGRCGHRGRFGKQEKVNTHSLAWRSFWLGLSSCLLLFFTGLPAMYYGIRSLLRMRFVRPEPIDRVAAATGTALGGCFGLGVGGILVSLGLVIGLALWTMDRTEEPDQVQQRWSAHFDAPLPDSVQPRMAQTVFRSIHRFRFHDHDLVDRRTLGLQFLHQDTMVPMNTNQLMESVKKANLPERAQESPRLQQKFDWLVNDNIEAVSKRVFHFERSVEVPQPNQPPPADGPQESVTIHQYYTVITSKSGFYMIAMVIDPERADMSEEQIRDWFAKVRLVSGAR